MPYSWLFFSIFSLLVAGLFALLAALTRMPSVKLLATPYSFYTALVVHVILATVVWFVAFMGFLWEHLSSKHSRREFKKFKGVPGNVLAWIGLLIIITSGVSNVGKPVLVDYFPVIDHPTYFAGLISISFGILVTIYGYIRSVWGREMDITSYGMLCVAFIMVLVILSIPVSLILNGTSSFQTLFWGPGHIFQIANTLSMVVAWILLLNSFATFQNAVEKAARKLMLVYPIVSLTSLPLFLLPPEKQMELFTLVKSYGIGIPTTLIFTLILIRVMGIRDRIYWNVPLSSLVLSMILFAVGGTIAVLGDLQGNLRVPAHYHGTLGAVTISFMGVTYMVLPEVAGKIKSAKVAKIQLFLYAIGTLIMVSGLFWAGIYGEPRKTFGYRNPATELAMNLMGFGAVLAALGGGLFVFNALLSLMSVKR